MKRAKSTTETSCSTPKPKDLINDRYKIKELIGKGGFGYIFQAYDTKTKQHVAIKFEKRGEQGKRYLEREYALYKRLDHPSFLKVIEWGKWEGNNMLVLELEGPSLSALYSRHKKKFSIATVFILAEKMITRIEELHNAGILHRDIKPGNFLIGRKDGSQLKLIDFGLSSPYLLTDGAHIPYSEKASFHGTHRYASLNSHFRVEQSRRDDLEALGHVLVYFSQGLPWQNVKIPKKAKKRKFIGQLKKMTGIEELTEGLPSAFSKYITYCRSLGFFDKPDYEWCRRLFRRSREKLKLGSRLDWMDRDIEEEPLVEEKPAPPTPIPSQKKRKRRISSSNRKKTTNKRKKLKTRK